MYSMESQAPFNPTSQAYSELQKAYDLFNVELFHNELPHCLITLQRKGRTYGYFSYKRFETDNGETLVDEIAMNPEHFHNRAAPEVLSTLVHEMVHLQQFYFGKPSIRCYHNRQWADMMEAVGLIPSDTGQPEGKRTGQNMSHYIEHGGNFDRACQKLIATGFTISWGDSIALLDETEVKKRKAKKNNTRTKFTCPQCKLNMWGKDTAKIICGLCMVDLCPAET